MTPRELISNLSQFDALDLSLILTYLADHAYEARLADGMRLCDATDFKAWLRELADAARIPESTKVQSPTEIRPRPTVMPPVPQRRWDGFCPDCGHVHADERECGWAIGGGRVCRCERAVSA